MKTRLLHVEDEPTDAELVTLWLQEAGLDWDIVRAQTRDEFVRVLDGGDVDIILSDYRLPAFDGLEALRVARARRPELAFVFFTGSLGEERAVEALKAGATDFVVKTRPDRLVPALQRALKETQERTGRLRAEEALKRREADFRVLFEANPHPMWVLDRETLRFLEVNAAAVEHYGYSRAEFLGMGIQDIRARDESAGDESRAGDEGDQGVLERSGPRRQQRKDGRAIEVEMVAHNLDFEGRPGRLVVAHDGTEKRRLEAQLLQAQKLEAIGQLASGVAHDFNNLLNVITGYGDLLLRKMEPDDAARPRVDQILRATERGAALTHQLLAFSRKQVLEPRVVDLNVALQDIEPMLRRLIGENIDIVARPDPGLGRVRADPGQFEQILVNLAVNARDAMPRGGSLIFETANVDLDETFVRTHPGAVCGPHVRLAVSDTGHGMDSRTVSRIFEPFFTTKPRGKGTGLGLATVYGIVKQSGGMIDVYSEPGHGTSFKIYLPRVDEDASPREGRGEDEEFPGGSETILLVEDDDALRELIREMLAESGYTVLDASGPEQGLAVARSHAGAIDLFMTDVILPRMSGGELATRLQAARPEARVLFMSGYTDEAIGHHGVIGPDIHFLQKPFTQAALLRKLRSILEATPGDRS